MKCMRIVISVILLFAIKPAYAAADADTDTLSVLSHVEGADMTLYSLYRDYRFSDKDKAMEYAELFLSHVDSLSLEPCLAPLYTEVSDWYEMERCRFSVAIRYMEKALEIYHAASDGYHEALTEYGLAKLYLKKGQYHKTLRYANKAVSFFEDSGHTSEMMECYQLLGIVYETCRDYEKSDEYYLSYVKAARIANDSVRLVTGLNNIAAFASSIGDTAKTIRLLMESIALSESAGDSAQLCQLYINAAAAYTQAGRYDEAEKYLLYARPLLSNIERCGHFWLQYATLYNRKGDEDSAVMALKNAASYYSQGEFDLILEAIYATLNEIYRDRGDTVTAYRYMSAMYDIYHKSGREDMLIELFKEQNEIELSREREQMELDRSRQKMTVLSVVFVIIAVTLSVALILRKRAFEIKKKELQIENDRKISEVKKNQQFRTDMILRGAIEKLQELSVEAKTSAVRARINAIIGELRNSKDEDSWKEVEQYVPEFNSAFFKNLIKDFPDLTVNESRLCVFLNRNLSTKQISEITRQSPESINVARTRLRKKLGLTGSDMSIQEFLRKYD